MKNVVLTGFMGTGKTSIGKILAKKLNCPVIDLDRQIEEKEKRKINEIFEKDGEAYFRRLEKEAVREAAQNEGVVITTGGGAVLDPENVRALREKGLIVALFAKPETIYKRVSHSMARPLLNKADKFSEIKKLLEIRRPFYEKCDLKIETDGHTATEVVDMILEGLKDKI